MYIEGSPIDGAVFTILIITGVFVLSRRRLNWSALFNQNKWIWLFFVFGALSMLWSDYPFVSFKRLIKALGTVTMALVVLSEDRPHIAIGVILRRLAFILLPLSVLFIKFYPELGRAYDAEGTPMYTGVGFQKNALGQICLLAGIYFAWNIFLGRREGANGHRLHYSIYLIILPMLAWLFRMANSATSLACMAFALCLFVVARQPVFVSKPHRIIIFGVLCVALFGMVELAFDIKGAIITLLGRKSDLTGRADVWGNYLSMVRNPIFGYGYEIFYTSVMMQKKIDFFRSTHNGYLEMYLNLGIIGLLFVAGWIATGLIKIWCYIEIDYSVAIMGIAFIIVVTLYSWTETTFAGTSNMWMLLFLAVMSAPGKDGVERSEMQKNTVE
jgi:O-antigen ligase